MRQEIKQAFGKNVGKFYDKSLRTVRGSTIDPGLKRTTIKVYPKGTAGYQGIEDSFTAGEKQIAERRLRKVQKDAARKYTTKVAKETAAKKVARISRLAKVTPAALVAGIVLEPAATAAADFGRKKFVESDKRKVKKLKKESDKLDKKMSDLRNRKTI